MSDWSIQVAGEGATAFRCGVGDTILAAALRSGLGFPHDCNSGGCGSCQFELIEGDVLDRWAEAPGISERQRGRGRRLACQSIPSSDCTIGVKLDAALVPPVKPRRFRARFSERSDLTADMAEFTFLGDGPAEFIPGQFAMLELPDVAGLRAYSMSNLPNPDGEWRFIVKRVPGGAGSASLFTNMVEGREVGVDAPFGNGYFRKGSRRAIVCIAGGAGLSPVMSILRAVGADTSFADRQLRLFYGGRGPADICVDGMLDSIPELRGRVEVFTAISDPEAPGATGWTGARGMIHDLVRETLGEGMTDMEFYFCGPPAMTDAIHRMLLIEAKVPAEQLHFDRFY